MGNEKIKALKGALSSNKDRSLLLLRVAVAPVFIQAGWGKFLNFDRTVGFFASINIPFPEINVVLAAGAELIGGILLLVGLMTQLASVPLAFVMLVALLTAHLAEITSLTALITLTPFIYLCIFILFSSFGAGKISLDAKLCPKD